MEYLRCVLRGTAPLLMHNPAAMRRDTGKRLSQKSIPAPEEEAAESRYLLPDGNFYVPAVSVRNSLLSGAVGYRIGRRAARQVLAAAVTLVDEAFPLLDGDGKARSGTDYVVDGRRVVVQRQGIIRARAKVDMPWSLECRFRFNSQLASLDHVKDALTNAGMMVGLLDYRPECMGWFGTFEIEGVWVARVTS